ncbi:MAG: HAMP domain-containing histidine kinase [Ignavibacteriales bacterium]|nr:HAMP domain-containing histidine kinase [Ignavibacteriales bacterium]
MKKLFNKVTPAARVIAILLFAVITPVLLFSVYELTATNETERMMQDAYIRQLDAILFSANQFASDAVTAWKKETEQLAGQQGGTTKNNSFFAAKNSLLGLVYSDSTLSGFSWLYNTEKNLRRRAKDSTNAPLESIGALTAETQIEIRESSYGMLRLFTFSRQKYFRTESIPVLNGRYILFAFVSESTNKLCGMLVERDNYIKEVILPRFRSIGGERFSIGVIDSLSGKVLFSTKAMGESNFNKTTGFWILPDMKIGIRLDGVNLEAINQERQTYLVILILMLNLLIIAAVYFVYRSIQKEMALALIKSEFVSNVSHELRTPLSLIGMFAETLESGRVKTEEKKKEYYGIISQETKRLSRIVNKILNFSQIEAGVRKYNFEKHSLNDVAGSVFNSYQFHFQQKDFNASIQLLREDIMVTMDKEAVTEAVINLLDNGMKYSRDTKEISVKTGVRGGNAFIAVTDSGIGISPADKDRIFEKFFRVSEGGTHNVKGTGLGLSIVKHIAEAHGGYIGLESKPGNGSTFTIYLSLQ